TLTESVRLPSHAIEACVNLAKALDQAPPESESNSEFGEYLSFVQNLATPNLFTVHDGKGERRYLMQSEPITLEEYRLVKRAVEELTQRMDAEKLSNHDRLWLLSQMVEKIFPQMKT
ncbi:MAG: hypothetical protein ACRDL7_14205, partial [Gaiellaceae bacterium]